MARTPGATAKTEREHKADAARSLEKAKNAALKKQLAAVKAENKALKKANGK